MHPGHTGKRKYPSRAAAEQSAARIKRRLRAYHCSVCSKWHLGHSIEDYPRTLDKALSAAIERRNAS